MIYEVSIWEQNINKCLSDIGEMTSISSVFLNCFFDIDFKKMGGSQSFLFECINVCQLNRIPVLLGVLLPKKYNNNYYSILDSISYDAVKVIEWPTFFIHRTFYLMNLEESYLKNKKMHLDILNTNVNLNCKYDFTFITMNNIAKFHRMMLMDILAKYNLFEYGAVAWRNVNRTYNNLEDSLKNPTYNYKYWTPKALYLDQDTVYNLKFQELLPKEYNQAFMQIVTESETKHFVITEKTAVPLLFNKLFLVVSCKNFHKNLEDLGFKLYEELFDYSFDSFDKLEDRVEGVVKNVQQITKMSNLEKEKALNCVIEKIKYNRQRALKSVINDVPKEIYDIGSKTNSFSHLCFVEKLLQNVY